MLQGINRNIVECKASIHTFSPFSSPVLIETLWNVKLFDSFIRNIYGYSINRNIVECKVCSRHMAKIP